jgi:hypothetical protein
MQQTNLGKITHDWKNFKIQKFLHCSIPMSSWSPCVVKLDPSCYHTPCPSRTFFSPGPTSKKCMDPFRLNLVSLQFLHSISSQQSKIKKFRLFCLLPKVNKIKTKTAILITAEHPRSPQPFTSHHLQCGN